MTLEVPGRDGGGLSVPHSGLRHDIIVKHMHHLLLKLQNFNGLDDKNAPLSFLSVICVWSTTTPNPEFA